MPKFNVEFAFKIDCFTRGYTIEAKDEKEAALRASQAIDEYGYVDWKKAEKLGLNIENGSWGLSDGSDHQYEVNEVELEYEAAEGAI